VAGTVAIAVVEVGQAGQDRVRVDAEVEQAGDLVDWLRMASMSCPARVPPRATPFDKNLDICDSSSVFVTRRFVSTKAPAGPPAQTSADCRWR
jgi:hypothetical protein